MLRHTFQPLICPKRKVYNKPSATWGGTMVASEGEILGFSTLQARKMHSPGLYVLIMWRTCFRVNPYSKASLTKWLSVRLRNKWLWVRVPLQSFSGIFTYLKLVLKYYNFAIFQHTLCKISDESLQKKAVNMDLQCILCITNSSYAVKTPKDEVTCNKYWNFYKKLKIWKCFPQNEKF